MTRYEAMNAIYDVINSGILSNECKEKLTEVVNCICEEGFETCPKECLKYCKKDECEHAEPWEDIEE